MELATVEISQHADKNKRIRPNQALRPQVIIGLVCLLIGVSIGMSLAYSAVLLPALQNPNSTLFIDQTMGSWITSVHAAASPIGSLTAGVAMEQWGRRKIALTGSLGLALGWSIISGAQNPSMLIVGRIMDGLFKSLLATSLTVLIDELADPKFRGFTLAFIMTMLSIGVTMMMSLGVLLDWRVISGSAALLALLSIGPLINLKESPSWLVRKNNFNEAAESLKWLWGPGQEEQVREDLEILRIRFQTDSTTQEKSRLFDKLYNMFQYFFQSRNMKPFLILHFFNTIQAFCGLTIFTYYAIDILAMIRQTEGNTEVFNDNVTGVVMSIIRIPANIAATLLLIRIGRRTIALISGIGSSLSALLLSISLYLTGILVPAHIEHWMNFISTLGFVMFSAFGFFLLPPLMLGETQPSRIRGFVCGYIYTVNDLAVGAVLKCYPTMVQNLEVQGLFLLFGMSCLTCTIFVYLFLPETQGKTLEEIEDYFKMPNIMWITRKKSK